MNTSLAYVGIPLLLIGLIVGYFIGADRSASTPIEGEQKQEAYAPIWEQYQNSTYGISFIYEAGANGYVLLEPDPDVADTAGLVDALMLMDAPSFRMLQMADEPQEGPPAISILVLENPDAVPVEEWIGNVNDVVVPDLSTFREAAINTAPAIRFEADGLYRSNNVAFAHEGHIFLISGGFIDRDSKIVDDFETLLNSIQLSQPTAL